MKGSLWIALIIAGCVLWLGLMVAASYWGYLQRDPVRIEQPGR
jgi:flagellar basal body-associated protein FliL